MTAGTTTTHWRLDPHGSRAEFRVRTLWGLTTVHGGFGRLEGSLDADADGPRRMELAIAAASLDTGNARRDRHLRSADFFDCERHPRIRFRSTRVSAGADGRLRVEGELEAAGRRLALCLEPDLIEGEDGRLDVRADAEVDQHRLGMTSRRFGIRTPARLTVHARLVRRP